MSQRNQIPKACSGLNTKEKEPKFPIEGKGEFSEYIAKSFDSH